jgi:D-alanyl-D-alanine carboxypeptidase/D-alanyl-D-alanine-endopeptidase (penicillin-binding protein 4)
MVVYDLTREKELINYNGGKYFIPASTVKLFTFLTAYSTLPDSVPSIEYLEKGDSLLIRGTADPLLLSDGPDEVVNFLKSWEGNVFLADKSIDDSKYGPGWSWDDFASSYMPERNILPLYENRVTLSRNDSVTIEPGFFKETLQKDGSGEAPSPAMKTYRDPNQNLFDGKKVAEGKEVSVPFITSNQLAADLLGEALGKKVTLIRDHHLEDFKTLMIRSYDSLYARMLIDSDNFVAEQVMLQVGRATTGKYQVKAAILRALDSVFPDIPQKPRWVDGSGLSRYNLFTPESMVYLLKKMHRQIPEEELFALMAQGGVSGTLENHFKGVDDKPYVIAKSGTLSNNYCLSGFLKTSKGRLLAFSFMDNHYQGSSEQKKRELESYLELLRDSN